MYSTDICTLRFADGGREPSYPDPPAQNRTCGFPASGSCLRSNVIGLRGIGYPYSSDPWARCFSDMPVPALCPGLALQLTLPSLDRPPSLHRLRRRCHSALFEASQVLCSRPTSHPRACPSFGCCLHEPVRSSGRTRMRSPKFRRKDVITCTWGLRLREAPHPQAICAGRMLLSGQQNGVSTSEFDPFRRSIPSPWSPL